MTKLDYYSNLELDASIILNYPNNMSGVLSQVEKFLNSKKRYVVDEGDMSVAKARKLIEEATGDTSVYHVVNSGSKGVWDVLRNAVNEDSLRVIGIFHGALPKYLPQNTIILDIGRSLHRKVPKQVQASISEAILQKGKYPVGQAEELFYGMITLCYEVIYSPDAKLFKQNVLDRVATAYAFDFMYNPPSPLDKDTMKAAVVKFVSKVHGELE